MKKYGLTYCNSHSKSAPLHMEFCLAVPDKFDERSDQKIFYKEILVKLSKGIHEDGSDDLEKTIEANYHKVK